jgi:hypothetical protein
MMNLITKHIEGAISMNIVRVTVIGGLIVLLAGCSSTSVRFDYDRQQDFSRFKTFDFYPIPKEIGPDANPLVVKRIKDAVIRELAHKGFAQAETNPDLLIAIHTESQDRFNVTDWGYHYAPYDYYWRDYGYWYDGGIDVHQYEEGTLTLDFVSVDNDEMVWRGVASRALPYQSTSEQIDKLVKQAVSKILENFPPPKK